MSYIPFEVIVQGALNSVDDDEEEYDEEEYIAERSEDVSLNDNTKETNFELKECKCPSCTAGIMFEEDKEYKRCEYCGSVVHNEFFVKKDNFSSKKDTYDYDTQIAPKVKKYYATQIKESNGSTKKVTAICALIMIALGVAGTVFLTWYHQNIELSTIQKYLIKFLPAIMSSFAFSKLSNDFYKEDEALKNKIEDFKEGKITKNDIIELRDYLLANYPDLRNVDEKVLYSDLSNNLQETLNGDNGMGMN